MTNGWSTDWTRANSDVTPQLVEKIGGVLVRLIEASSENYWGGKLGQLMAECGESDMKEYGTYFNAMPIVKEKYKIISKSAGPNGNKYYFCDENSI